MAYGSRKYGERKKVNYLSKDFVTFKNNLLDFAESYFPENFNDFSEGNPAMMFLEMSAYVGDVLSYYTDNQIQETFLTLARESENIFNMAYSMGYTPRVTSVASVMLDITQLVPSKVTENDEYVPDYEYALNVVNGSQFESVDGPIFRITQDANFQFSSSLSPTSSSIHQYNSSGNPQYYILKKSVPAISATERTTNYSI